MKGFAYTLLPLVASAAAVRKPASPAIQQDQFSIARRQAGLNLGGLLTSLTSGITSFIGKEKPFSVEELPPVLQRNDSKRVRIRWGPVELRPGNAPKPQGLAGMMSMDPSGTTWNYIVDGIPRDATILQVNTTIVNEDGSRADTSNGAYMHHVMMGDLGKTGINMQTCPGMPSMSVPVSVFAGGSEDNGPTYFSTPDGTFDAGYYLGKDNTIVMTSEAVNYANESKKIFTESVIEYIPGKPKGFYDVSIQMVSATGCEGGVAFQPPHGQTAYTMSTKTPLKVTEDGYILARRGHLHDGGVNIDFKVNGKSVCDSQAIYGGESGTLDRNGKVWETIAYMTECYEPVKVAKGDNVTLEANYDLVKHPAREHVEGGMAEEMGIMSFSFAAERSRNA